MEETNESMPSAVLVVVDSDADALAHTADELDRRYGSDYRIVAVADPGRWRRHLDDATGGLPIALVLAAQRDEPVTGVDVLADVAEVFPTARRGLLVDFGAWADPGTAEAIRTAIALGRADYYVLRPWRRNDEYFHRTVSEFLHEWARGGHGGDEREFVVIDEGRSRRGHELRDLLTRNGIPHAHLDATSEQAHVLLDRLDLAEPRLPVVVTVDGRALEDPTNEELARFYGVDTGIDHPGTFDLAIVGAGPAGLAAAVSAAAEGLSTVVVERESIGGQAGSSSKIRNYLGFARGVAGSELAQRAYQQAWVFGVDFVHMTEVTELRSHAEGHVLALSNGTEVRARAVVLAMGMSYRRLDVGGLDDFVGLGVHYGASVSEGIAVADEPVFVVGGGNSAGQAALHLARYASLVTMVVRSASLEESMSDYLRTEIENAPDVEVRVRAEVVGVRGVDRLEEIDLRDRDSGVVERLRACGLFLFIGASPRTVGLPDAVARDDRGFVLTGVDAATALDGDRSPGMFETSVPGVFAVGDVRSGSVKRVASAVGEGSVAVAHLGQYLEDLQSRRTEH